MQTASSVPTAETNLSRTPGHPATYELSCCLYLHLSLRKRYVPQEVTFICLAGWSVLQVVRGACQQHSSIPLRHLATIPLTTADEPHLNLNEYYRLLASRGKIRHHQSCETKSKRLSRAQNFRSATSKTVKEKGRVSGCFMSGLGSLPLRFEERISGAHSQRHIITSSNHWIIQGCTSLPARGLSWVRISEDSQFSWDSDTNPRLPSRILNS
jgi:hypothetical protein